MSSQTLPCSHRTGLSHVQDLCQQAQINGRTYCAGVDAYPQSLESGPLLSKPSAMQFSGLIIICLISLL